MSEEHEENEDYMKHFRDLEKEMLKIDLDRGSVMPLTVDDFTDLFGEPTEVDLSDMTQSYLRQYHRHGEEHIPIIVESFSKEWVTRLLKHNEDAEEYELCAIIKEHLDVCK